MIWAKRIGTVLALGFVMLTVINASWLAPNPKGNVKLIAHRGVYQAYDQTDLGRDDCTATRIEQPVHGFLENTADSIIAARELGAQMIEVDIAPTKDGQIALFHDWTVDCRTEASGDTRDFTMAELKALDIGYGYTADGGKTFPFRGQHIGGIATLEEGLKAAFRTRLAFNFKSKNPDEADLLVAALKAADHNIANGRDIFYGHQDVIARLKELAPDAWAFSTQGAKQCTTDYTVMGWFGIMPDSCKGGTIFIALDLQWTLPGWPNRMIARMEEHDVQMIMLGPQLPDNYPRGVDIPEQLGDIPRSFNGWLWVDDIYTIGPSLRPAFNTRTEEQSDALDAALKRRRAARE